MNVIEWQKELEKMPDNDVKKIGLKIVKDWHDQLLQLEKICDNMDSQLDLSFRIFNKLT